VLVLISGWSKCSLQNYEFLFVLRCSAQMSRSFVKHVANLETYFVVICIIMTITDILFLPLQYNTDHHSDFLFNTAPCKYVHVKLLYYIDRCKSTRKIIASCNVHKIYFIWYTYKSPRELYSRSAYFILF